MTAESRPTARRGVGRTVLAVATAILALVATGSANADGHRRAADPDQSGPTAIPAVRAFSPEAGPGWRPGRHSRVVADPRGPLADEARRLAGELGLRTAAGPARRGDVELTVKPVAGDEHRTDERDPEAYTLATHDGRVLITGDGEAGAFYGTRTLLQSVRADGRVPQGVVRDRPDRPQRGLNLDIVRKSFTADWIEDRVREAADLKLNQVGLHFSDDQGFRVESSSHPEIVSERHLSKAELRRIIDLAERLHITVIPEIDAPGHLGGVLAAHPSLQLRDVHGTPARGAIDIGQPESGKIVDDLIREYAPLFRGAYWHLGGDEYRALTADDPEAAYPRLATLARQKYGERARVRDLTTGWLNDRAALVRSLGKRAKAWNDGFFRGGVVRPDADREVEYWTGQETRARPPQEYLREGRRVVNVNDEYLYYVLGEPNNFRYPTGERIYREWSPAVLRGTERVPAGMSGPDRVLGGRLAVWCDYPNAQTQEQVARGIRLPLRALAQRLWDPRPPALSWDDFTDIAERVRSDGR